MFFRGGWVMQRCRVSYVTRASSWYWLTVGQGLLSLQQVRVEEECFYFFFFFFFFFFHFRSVFSFFTVPLFHLLYFLFLFSPPLRETTLPGFRVSPFSQGDDTKWPTMVFVSFNPNTINQSIVTFSGRTAASLNFKRRLWMAMFRE